MKEMKRITMQTNIFGMQSAPGTRERASLSLLIATTGIFGLNITATTAWANEPDSGNAKQKATILKTDASAKSAVAGAKLWKMEVELRDDPVCVEAEFDLSPKAPKAIFRTAIGELNATEVKLSGGKMTFHLPANPVVGEQTGEANFVGGTMIGKFQAFTKKKEVLKFHGRLKLASDSVARSVSPNIRQGPGFQDLKIEANGISFSLAERMKYHRVPGVSIARIENFEVVETGSYGVEDIQTGVPVDTETRFQAGGMGSPLVNMLALRLAALGKLDLSREANSYLKGSPVRSLNPLNPQKTTVLDLVNSTSGLSQSKFSGYRPGESHPSLIQLIEGADKEEMASLTVDNTLSHVAGGAESAILQQVIVEATGHPFAEVMDEEIFRPFGMTHSGYEDKAKLIVGKKYAMGHYSSGERMLDLFHAYPESGDSGLWTTAGDFAKALCQVQRLLSGRPNALLDLSNETHRNLYKAVLNEKKFLGFIQGENGYLYRGGDPYGFFANHRTHISNGRCVIVMENRIMGWALNNEIIEAVSKKNGWTLP